MSKDPSRPNVILVLADNLGWGELGCYGGGALRGAATPRIDALAKEALTQWEVTLPECLKARNYSTAHHGKWHLGDIPGRYPSDRGFDQWFGIPRTTDESQFTSAVGFEPEEINEMPYIMEGKAGQNSENVHLYDLEKRREIDHMLVEKSKKWFSEQANQSNAFFLYHPLVHLHFPTLPHREFAGKTGNGDFADSMAEMDHRLGQLLDHVDHLGLRENTVFIFASDNGPEFRPPYMGTAGPWMSTYHTAIEGSLRVPCIILWPDHVPAGHTSNEMVHVTDLFSTICGITGAQVPADRPMDGIDQRAFFEDPEQTRSERKGFMFYLKDELRAIKWKDWKLHLVWEPKVNQSSGKLESPYLFNLLRDPKEETDILPYNTWVIQPMKRLQAEFMKSLKSDPAPRDPLKEL